VPARSPDACALLLDLDGTLIDARRRQVELARHLAPSLDGDRFWAAKRAGATTRRALADQGVADAEALAAAWVAAVEETRWLALDAVLPGAAEAIAAVRAAGLAPLVLTARRDAAAVRAQVAALSLDVPPPLVVDPREAATAKAAVLRASAAAGFVGDSESDHAAAAAAQVPFAAVAGGQRDAAFLAARGIAPVCEGVYEAVAVLLGEQTT